MGGTIKQKGVFKADVIATQYIFTQLSEYLTEYFPYARCLNRKAFHVEEHKNVYYPVGVYNLIT